MAEMIEYISKLTVPERLQVMELLWKSLASADYESPEWHEFMSLAESKRLLAERFRVR